MSKWTEGAEGFICPYCLVSFASSNKLQAHFIDFHSNEGSDAAVVFEPQSSTEEVSFQYPSNTSSSSCDFARLINGSIDTVSTLFRVFYINNYYGQKFSTRDLLCVCVFVCVCVHCIVTNYY